MTSRGTTSSPTDFVQFYQLQQNSCESMFGEHVVDGMARSSTVTTTSPMSPSSPGDSSPGDSSPFSSNLNPEGRVSKPARRRSRASRRTPTTLVNTDPSNFRAMVQQFTGDPAAAYAPDPRYQMLREGNISFGFRQNQQILNLALDAQQQQQQQQIQAHHHHQQQQQQIQAHHHQQQQQQQIQAHHHHQQQQQQQRQQQQRQGQQQQRQAHQQQLQFQHNMFSSINRNHDGSLP